MFEKNRNINKISENHNLSSAQSMTTTFQGSRLANLRQKKQYVIENIPDTKQTSKQLTLLDEQDSSYQPSMTLQGGRTATRFLKGRIQRPSGSQKTSQKIFENQPAFPNKQNNIDQKPSLKLNNPPSGQLKLVLNDSPQFEKKTVQLKIAPQQLPQKRILIQKKESDQEQKSSAKEIRQESKSVVQIPVDPIQEQPITARNSAQNVIKQEDVQESKDVTQNQNELVECSEGCGRKFNRKALQKHAKACKLVFMSKRKEFNSQAKRLTSQEQAALIKQNKLQQKKAQISMTKGKGFDKTGENWKAASEDFRSALKAIKKEGAVEQEGKQELKTVQCQFCQKPFAEVLLPKHVENCIKRKEKEQKDKKKTTKKLNK